MEIQNILNYTNSYFKNKKELEKRKPYHFNIIDVIKSRETDHSRILGTILSKNDYSNFNILNSYLKYFKIPEKAFNPEIYIEKNGIDILIIDKKGNYGIIIENKIFNAIDQPNQLENYFSYIKNQYRGLNIYIQYLTKFGRKVPSESSLPTHMKTSLGNNFNIISYSDDILEWLTKHILPECRIKNKEFVYSLELYTDYIKGITNNRMDNSMKSELKLKVYESLEVDNKSLKDKADKINETVKEIEIFKNFVDNINLSITYEIREKFFRKLYNKLLTIGNWECVTFVTNKSVIENCNHRNFGFKNLDYCMNGIYFSIELQDYRRYLAGFIISDPLLYKNLSQKLEPYVGHVYKKDHGWLVRLFKDYKIEIEDENVNFVTDFYNPDFNTYFLENMELIVDKYFDNTVFIFNIWKNFKETNLITIANKP